MTVSQKAALSLLISVVAGAVVSVLAFTGFFDLIETRFYNPSIANAQIREINRDARIIQAFLTELETNFSGALQNDAVERSFLPNQSAGDIFERTRIYGLLLESQKGLQSVRFVDSGGQRIHFSTNPGDILSQNEGRIAYQNYADLSPFSPYDELAVPDQGEPKLTIDQRNDRIVFSFPFYDSLEVYRGTALYSLSVRAVADMLIMAGRLKVGEDLSLISVPPGMVSGISVSGKNIIIPVISSVWSEGIIALDSENSPSSLVLISAKTENGLYIGRVVEEKIFAFPGAMKLILLASLFLTMYLTIFLCFNLRADTVTVIQNRLKNLELSLIREYYERKGEMDWNHWYRELENRREDVRAELKRGIKTKNAAALMEDIDILINKSWDEILVAIGGKRETRLAIDEDKLQNILNRVLLATGTSPVLPGGGAPQTLPVVQKPETPVKAVAGEVKEASAVEEVEDAEDLEEAETVEDAEDLEEAEAVEDAEDLEEAEAVEDAEDLEEAEAVGEAEELEEAEAVEEVEALEEAEELEEFEDAGEAEELSADSDSAHPPSIESSGAEDVPAAKQEKPVLSAEEIAGAEAELAKSGKKSNIQLVFGDDDIPYIVESSGLELVDADTVSAIDNVSAEDEMGDLEDLDELEELEDLDEPEEPGSPDEVPGKEPPVKETVPEVDVASRIEFSETGKETEEDEINGDLEVVSPFATMLSRFDDDGIFRPEDADETAQKTKTSGRLEELNAEGMSLVYKPFQNEEVHSPELLDSSGPAGIIEEKDGVNYVNEKAKLPDEEMEKNLDPALKNLVNSVIKK